MNLKITVAAGDTIEYIQPGTHSIRGKIVQIDSDPVGDDAFLIEVDCIIEPAPQIWVPERNCKKVI